MVADWQFCEVALSEGCAVSHFKVPSDTKWNHFYWLLILKSCEVSFGPRILIKSPLRFRFIFEREERILFQISALHSWPSTCSFCEMEARRLSSVSHSSVGSSDIRPIRRNFSSIWVNSWNVKIEYLTYWVPRPSASGETGGILVKVTPKSFSRPKLLVTKWHLTILGSFWSMQMLTIANSNCFCLMLIPLKLFSVHWAFNNTSYSNTTTFYKLRIKESVR